MGVVVVADDYGAKTEPNREDGGERIGVDMDGVAELRIGPRRGRGHRKKKHSMLMEDGGLDVFH